MKQYLGGRAIGIIALAIIMTTTLTVQSSYAARKRDISGMPAVIAASDDEYVVLLTIEWYSDRHNGRYAVGAIMSYFGWNGKDDFRASKKLLYAFTALTQTGVCKDLVIQLNDSDMSFDKIADYLDQLHELRSIDLVEY